MDALGSRSDAFVTFHVGGKRGAGLLMSVLLRSEMKRLRLCDVHGSEPTAFMGRVRCDRSKIEKKWGLRRERKGSDGGGGKSRCVKTGFAQPPRLQKLHRLFSCSGRELS